MRREILLLCLTLVSCGGPSRSRVDSLPGYGPPPTKHYTGFVPVDSPSGSTLFYYVVESQSNPSSDPLIWWMNGGPGSSSMFGWIGEMGPLLLAADGQSLFQNPYSWNRAANLLFVEFAPGIGYSYCANSSDPHADCKQSDGSCSPCYADDTTVATQNVAFISAFLQNPVLFPEFRGRPLYLAGESYAGVYLPTLALRLLQQFPDTSIVNLNGLWVTDPCTDNAAQFGWLDMSINFAYNMGQITESVFRTLSGPDCTSNITMTGDRNRVVDSQECRHAWRQYDFAFAGLGEDAHPADIPGLPMYIDPLNVFGMSGGPDPEAYFNRADVRKALNATATNTPNGVYHIEIGNNGYPQYTQKWAACNGIAPKGLPSMLDVYKQIFAITTGSAKNLKVVIISSGVQDSVVNTPGTEAAVLALGFPIVPGGDRRPWFYNATSTDAHTLLVKPFAWGPTLHSAAAGAQIGGFITDFNTGSATRLMFTTVHRSGHMVPAYAPQSALHVIEKALLQNGVICPLLPTNWDSVSDEVFYARGSNKKRRAPGIFANWIVQAMSGPFIN